MDDWNQLEVSLGHRGIQNFLYLNDAEEEGDGEEVEQGQDGRRVMVSKIHNTNIRFVFANSSGRVEGYQLEPEFNSEICL